MGGYLLLIWSHHFDDQRMVRYLSLRYKHPLGNPTKSRLGTPGEPRKKPPGVVYYPMHKYYIIHSNMGTPMDKEITGIAKIPNRYRIWSGHAIDGGDVIEITESEYFTYQAFELFVEYKWVETNLRSFAGMIDYTVYLYNPNIYEVMKNGRVEPI